MHMKIDRVADMKEKWAKDKAMKKSVVEQRRADEIRFLQETAVLEAELRRKMLNVKRETESKKKSNEREVLQAFSSDRVHAVKETERMKKDRRKRSVLMNNEIVNERREKGAEMEQNKHDAEIRSLSIINPYHSYLTTHFSSLFHVHLLCCLLPAANPYRDDVENSVLQSRREDFLKLTEARKAEEQRRRESMVGRGLTAQQHREVAEQMEREQHDNEVSLLQSRREDYLKLTEARKAEEDRRRESMVGRGLTAQQHREVAGQMEQAHHDEATDELQYRHYLREQKAESERDEARRSRESLAGRLNTWRAHRSIEGTTPTPMCALLTSTFSLLLLRSTYTVPTCPFPRSLSPPILTHIHSPILESEQQQNEEHEEERDLLDAR